MPLYSLSANQIEKLKNQPLVLQKAIDMVKSSLAGHYSHSSHSSTVLIARTRLTIQVVTKDCDSQDYCEL